MHFLPHNQPKQQPRMNPNSPNTRNRTSSQRRTPRGKKNDPFGAEPGALMDDLIMRVGGAVLDAMDIFEKSAVEAGVQPDVAAKAKESSTVKLRNALGVQLACLRSYALRNVFALPPNSDEAVLDKQIALCTARLAEARAKTRQVDAAQSALQRRIDALNEAHSALPGTLVTDAKGKIERTNMKNNELENELDDMCDRLPCDNETKNSLPPTYSIGGHCAREFDKQRDSDDDSSVVDEEVDAAAMFNSAMAHQ